MSWIGLSDFVSRARERLDPEGGPYRLPDTGDGLRLGPEHMETVRPAAVLIGVIDREAGASLLLTKRPDTMADHAGQVAFPGGKVDATDRHAVAAALRESREEVGVQRDDVQLIGCGAHYVTGSGFRILPVVGVVRGDFMPVPEPGEVAAVFEIPMRVAMDPRLHVSHTAMWRGMERQYYEINHDGWRIWGVTAGIIRALWARLYGPGAQSTYVPTKSYPGGMTS